jgi:Phosphotransferase enzyme family
MLARREVRALLRAFFDKRDQRSGLHTPASLEDLYFRELGGGYSGSFVALLWLPGFPTLVMKAGPAEMIQQETEARQQYLDAQPDIKSFELSYCSDPVEVEIEGREELWRMMMYRYAGSLTHQGISRFSDFEGVFKDFIDPDDPAHRPAPSALEDWLERLFEQIASRKLEDEAEVAKDGVRSKPLSTFLPELHWDDGLQAVLSTAAAFVPEGDHLSGFRSWWEDAVQRESLAPYANTTRLHGDLRFANVLVNRTTAEVELIDFGHSTTGHVFRDLARFECDLLFRIAPPAIETQTARRSAEDRRVHALELAFGVDFHPPAEDPSDPDNPQIMALRILRGVYDRLWHVNADAGRRRMYHWFLLAEVLKRLTWTGEVFGTDDGRRALLQSVIMLKHSLEGRKARSARLLRCGQPLHAHGLPRRVHSDPRLRGDDQSRPEPRKDRGAPGIGEKG